MFKIILSFLVSFNFVFALEDCKKCHNVEKFEPKNHSFACKKCHILPKKRDGFTHEDIITHPASSKYMNTFCGSCHQNDIKKFKNSNHFTHKNEINLVFKTFGLDTNYTLQTLPKVDKITSKKDLIVDLLRRKCLVCHSENTINYDEGMYHGKGCMSCHIKYDSDGTYSGKDLHVKGKKPFAKIHKMGKIQNSNCLSCHNKNFVGTDYLGLFPKDFDKAYKAPLNENGTFKKKIYGANYHTLNSDIHYQKGLTCVDCHKKSSISGEKKLTCKSCHEVKPNVAHESYHEKLSCVSCHASWQMSNYELSLLRDDTKTYEQWKNLTYQEDGYLERFLNYTKKNKNIKPKMYDYLSGKLKKGIWYSGWRFRRWEHLLLGNDKFGKIQILRPFFQYRISYKDKKGNIIFDDLSEESGSKFEAFMPYTPHTVTKNAKSCEACHENQIQFNDFANKGIMELYKGKTLKSTLLNKQQLNKLNSKKYKQIRARMILKD